MDRLGPTGKVSKKTGPPFEVDLFSRLDRSDRNNLRSDVFFSFLPRLNIREGGYDRRLDRNGSFHLTIPTYFQSQDLAVWYLPCTKWRKILITVLLRVVNSRSIGVTRTSM